MGPGNPPIMRIVWSLVDTNARFAMSVAAEKQGPIHAAGQDWRRHKKWYCDPRCVDVHWHRIRHPMPY